MRYILLLLLAGCGIDVHGHVDPIIVTHKIDLSAIEPYCINKCADALDFNLCKTTCINNFLTTLGAITVK
jgi:hypothetical protein